MKEKSHSWRDPNWYLIVCESSFCTGKLRELPHYVSARNNNTYKSRRPEIKSIRYRYNQKSYQADITSLDNMDQRWNQSEITTNRSCTAKRWFERKRIGNQPAAFNAEGNLVPWSCQIKNMVLADNWTATETFWREVRSVTRGKE